MHGYGHENVTQRKRWNNKDILKINVNRKFKKGFDPFHNPLCHNTHMYTKCMYVRQYPGLVEESNFDIN